MVNDVENFMSKKYVKKRNVKYPNAQIIIKKFAGTTESTTDVNSGIIATFYTKEQINSQSSFLDLDNVYGYNEKRARQVWNFAHL